ncbi:MAG: methylated-DNA--[protein]-cysteine S-methyltransferase [Acidobacteria bacterium]|nr:methylated-DNA--[protein]-cysteine S-methyltransferase [Acidobacteriota bacterium]
MSSPVGPLLIGVSENGLAALEFDRGKLSSKYDWMESVERTALYAQELREYFAGTRQTFSFPLDLRGTDFQLRCWHALLNIPYGHTRSYAELARAVGCPRGFRAVGSANHDNPVAIVVPCHRVIGSDGGLGGYGGGLDAKRWLLELEGARTAALAN